MPQHLSSSVGPSHLLDSSEIVSAGRKAWDRLRKNTSWADWVQVGEAIIAGRKALGLSPSVAPRGRLAKKFGDWRRANGFAELDKSDLRRLLVLMDNIAEVEQWRLAQPKQWTLNHPSTIYRKWKFGSRRTSPSRSTTTIRSLELNLDQMPSEVAATLSARLSARELYELLFALLDQAYQKTGISRRSASKTDRLNSANGVASVGEHQIH